MITTDDALTIFYPAAVAAYDLTADPGNGFKIQMFITADMDRVSSSAPKHRPLIEAMLHKSPCFGYVATRPGDVLIGFRGTETPEEWLCDFEAFPETCTTYGGMAGIHGGFQAVFNVIIGSLHSALHKVIDCDSHMYITGHSLGGALATLAAYDLEIYMTTSIKMCTFAAPRVGLENFTTYFDKYVPGALRVVNRWDIVPQLPECVYPLFGYRHVGQFVRIDGGITLDLRHAHSLEKSYFSGLQKLISATPKAL